jgi:23S rRNA (guanosine2251-2'-O)-methyltransferase
VVDKERGRKAEAKETVWLFGLHAVRDALVNPRREKLRLVVTKNALDKLAEAVAAGRDGRPNGRPAQLRRADRRRLGPSGRGAGGAAAELGRLADVAVSGAGAPLVVLLDRVTDPHNVGAVLRSAEVFGARAVIAPRHHSAPETGALAKTASGALERQPYLRVTNLAEAMAELKAAGYVLIGLDGEAPVTLAEAVAGAAPGRPSGWCWGPRGRACARRRARPATCWPASRRRGLRQPERLECRRGGALCAPASGGDPDHECATGL